MEWFLLLGVPEAEIKELAAKSAHCILCLRPYITAFFIPRARGDRPAVAPEGAVNFAFLGQFEESPCNTIFTTEYSVRTAMEAVYTLLDSTSTMMDGRKPMDMRLPFAVRIAKNKGLKMIRGTVVENLLKRYRII